MNFFGTLFLFLSLTKVKTTKIKTSQERCYYSIRQSNDDHQSMSHTWEEKRLQLSLKREHSAKDGLK